MTVQFRTLPQFGGDPRAVAEIVNGIMNGKTNNTGTITLATGDATTTTLNDLRIGGDSVILFAPASAAAYADSAPYGAFQDSTNQTAASTTVAYAVTFNTTDFTNGITLSNSSRLNVKNAGLYNLQFSIQLKNTTNDGQDVDIWFRKNGTNIANSNSRFHPPQRKSSGDPSHIIAALNFFVDMAANDYIEIVWRTANTGVSIEAFGTSTSPTRPAVPSAIATMNLVGGSGAATFSGIYASSQGKGTATISHFANSTANKTYKYVVVG
jgi:hypothetical protein